ncbi:MAG: sulfite exporter TauE/SafE family protein, partial [Actinomycetota bacterium]|nr:sulfite exporter TauE/SafE family protein [Actinomycetota bacterium]
MTLLLVAVVVAGAAAVQLAAGFGFGLAAVPLLAIALDPHDAVVVALTLATFTNGYQAISGRGHTDRGVAGRMLLGAAVGLPVGLLVFVHADDRWLGVLVGVAVLAAVVVIARGLDLRHAGPALDAGAGVLAGSLTMSVGVNGPPLVFVLQARHFDQQRFRSTITTVFAVLDVISVAVFAIRGDLNGDTLGAVAAALPGLAVGAAAGVV